MTLAYDLAIRQGAPYSVVFPVLDADNEPVDVTGWTAQAQVRDPAGVLLHEWSTTAGTAVCAGTSVTLTVAAAVSAAWVWRTGRYDLELLDLNDDPAATLAAGTVVVTPEITR